jgi:hypothetical protein
VGAVSCQLGNITKMRRNVSVGLGLLKPRENAKSLFR